jgi:hypothetical protein
VTNHYYTRYNLIIAVLCVQQRLIALLRMQGRFRPVKPEQLNLLKLILLRRLLLMLLPTSATLTHNVTTTTTSTGVTATTANTAAGAHAYATCTSIDYLQHMQFHHNHTQHASPRRSYRQLQSGTYGYNLRVQGVPFDLKLQKGYPLLSGYALQL